MMKRIWLSTKESCDRLNLSIKISIAISPIQEAAVHGNGKIFLHLFWEKQREEKVVFGRLKDILGKATEKMAYTLEMDIYFISFNLVSFSQLSFYCLHRMIEVGIKNHADSGDVMKNVRIIFIVVLQYEVESKSFISFKTILHRMKEVGV